MKTTIDIADDLVARAKAAAAERGVTLRSIVEQGLRLALEQDRRRKPYRMPDRSVTGRGLHPDAAGKSWADILKLSYGERG